MAVSLPFFTVEIKSREVIKPSSPTPPHLRRLQLSANDQVFPLIYTPLLLFYPENGDGLIDDIQSKSQILKSSLAGALTRFYPLAGRIKDEFSIECNDDGTDYLEAQVNCSVSDLLQRPSHELLRKLLPIDSHSLESGRGCLLIVQVNFFECGGLAIGACFSHTIADASTFISFINCWAAISGPDSNCMVSPNFGVALSIFPPLEPLPERITPAVSSNLAIRRIVIRGSKIEELKVKAASESVPQPSRVEAATALIWKCAMAASRSKNGSPKPSTLLHIVNLRKRIGPPLSVNSMGNICAAFFAQIKAGEIELPLLVSQIRRNLEEFNEKCAGLEGEEASSFIVGCKTKMEDLANDKDLNFYIFNSWCKFPLYEADFGWGKPSWVSNVPPLNRNLINMRDTKDGNGIEAWVALSQEDMAFFERDEELLAFASLDRSALN